MPLEDGVSLIKKAIDEKTEDILLKRWIPYQDQIGFEEFKDAIRESSKVDFRSAEEILESVKNILDGR